MNKKAIIKTSAVLAAVTAFAVGVAVPIAVRNHEQSWKVAISNEKGAHYVLTQLDPTQNKAAQTAADKMIWDLPSDIAGAQSKVAEFLGISVSSQAQLTLSKGREYHNGLEKLIFDLTSEFKANAEEFTLSFTNKGGSDIVFGKAFTSLKTVAEREAAVKAIFENDGKTKTAYLTAEAEGKLISSLEGIYFLNGASTDTKDNFKLTTPAFIETSINNIIK